MQTFQSIVCQTAADGWCAKLSNGSQAATLSATQSRDAIAALERLQEFYQAQVEGFHC